MKVLTMARLLGLKESNKSMKWLKMLSRKVDLSLSVDIATLVKRVSVAFTSPP